MTATSNPPEDDMERLLRSGSLSLTLILVAGGCGSVGTEADTAPSMDAHIETGLDRADTGTDSAVAADPDSSEADAPTIDAPNDTYSAPDIGTFDCGRSSSAETCNRFDDDCDGRVDETGCGSCGAVFREADVPTTYLLCSRNPRFGTEVLGDACADLGGAYRPVVIETTSEFLFLEDQAARTTREFLVGLHRTEAGWVWLDGQPLRTQDTPWAAGEPNAAAECARIGRDGLISVSCFERTASPYACEGVALPSPFAA